MNNLKTTLTLLGLTLLMGACSEDKLETFHGQDVIYYKFASETAELSVIDSAYYQLGYDIVPKTDSIVYIPTKVMGNLSDQRRLIKAELDVEESTAILGEDVEIVPELSYVEAGSANGVVAVRLYNNDKIKDSELRAVIKLMPNDSFLANYDITANASATQKGKKGNVFKVYYTGQSSMPNIWAGKTANLKRFFGDYSTVKFNFICSTLRLDRAYFTYDPATQVLNTVYAERFSTVLLVAWRNLLNTELDYYKQTHDGEPMRDENGDEIKMGPGL